MSALSKRLVASFALLAFAVTLLTGLVFQVSADMVIFRSLAAFSVFGALTGAVSILLERLWKQ